jgi:hypothetical protein
MTAMHKIDIPTGFIGPTLLLRKGTKKLNINFPVFEGGKRVDVEKRREIRPTCASVLFCFKSCLHPHFSYFFRYALNFSIIAHLIISGSRHSVFSYDI